MKRSRAGDDDDEEKAGSSISPKRPASELCFSELLNKYQVKCELGRGKLLNEVRLVWNSV